MGKGTAISNRLLDAVEATIFGQRALIERMVMATLCKGHILVEGVPGIAKTTAVKAYAAALGLEFSRIQFTPDLLPGDLIGTQMLHPDRMEFSVHTGPVMTNVLLADEINRAPAKVQSALLEAMQERQVTIGDTSYGLPEPFVVLATQNPLEHEGTYPLPEAQLDRFMFKVLVDYPPRSAEQRVLREALAGRLASMPARVVDAPDLAGLQERLASVSVSEPVQAYILDLLDSTRHPEQHAISDINDLLEYGVSPRGGVHLILAARCQALLAGRDFTTPDDVQAVLPDVFRHRLGLSFQAEAEDVSSEDLLQRIVTAVPVP